MFKKKGTQLSYRPKSIAKKEAETRAKELDGNGQNLYPKGNICSFSKILQIKNRAIAKINCFQLRHFPVIILTQAIHQLGMILPLLRYEESVSCLTSI